MRVPKSAPGFLARTCLEAQNCSAIVPSLRDSGIILHASPALLAFPERSRRVPGYDCALPVGLGEFLMRETQNNPKSPPRQRKAGWGTRTQIPRLVETPPGPPALGGLPARFASLNGAPELKIF